MLQGNTHFTRNPDFIFRTIVDELVLVPIHKDVADMDSIFMLNEVGAFIWERLQQPANITDLQSAVMEEFDADAETALADLEEFLAELNAFGAVKRS